MYTVTLTIFLEQYRTLSTFLNPLVALSLLGFRASVILKTGFQTLSVCVLPSG
jgi:hypothetical protein